MPAGIYQLTHSCPDISLAEIEIPEDGDSGTGKFMTTFSPVAFPLVETISSVAFNSPCFQITVTIECTREVTVLLGAADGTPPKHAVIFLLPENMPRGRARVLSIRFANWRVTSATLDGSLLARTPRITVH
jgi:hypothetical protein